MMHPHPPVPGFLVPSRLPAFSGQGAPDSVALSHVSEILQGRGALAAFTCHPGTLPEPGPDGEEGLSTLVPERPQAGSKQREHQSLRL